MVRNRTESRPMYDVFHPYYIHNMKTNKKRGKRRIPENLRIHLRARAVTVEGVRCCKYKERRRGEYSHGRHGGLRTGEGLESGERLNKTLVKYTFSTVHRHEPREGRTACWMSRRLNVAGKTACPLKGAGTGMTSEQSTRVSGCPRSSSLCIAALN